MVPDSPHPLQHLLFSGFLIVAILMGLRFSSLCFFFLNIYLFIYLAASGLSCSTRDPRCGMRDPSLRCADSSLQLVDFSLVVVHGLSSCPTDCGILVPWPGIRPASPALEDGFLTTGLPGKSLIFVLYWSNIFQFSSPLLIFSLTPSKLPLTSLFLLFWNQS